MPRSCGVMSSLDASPGPRAIRRRDGIRRRRGIGAAARRDLGMSREKLEQLTGCGLDVSRNHEEARALMRSLGYGPDGRLKVNAPLRYKCAAMPGAEKH